jgi:vacuolar-type H+-ATPase subunit I/STV1
MSLENYSPEAISELAALSKRLSEDPATRKDFLRLTKKVHPDLPVPEIEMEEATNSRVSAAEKRVMELEAKLRQKEVKEELAKRRNSLKEAGVARSEDDIKEIEKIMTEKGIANHDTAAEYWKWMKEASTPVSSGFPQPVMSRMDIQGYMKNPVGAARENAAAALAELRKNPRPIGL